MVSKSMTVIDYEDGMRALANYVNFDVLHASVNSSRDAQPWCDACLVAKKKGDLDDSSENVEDRLFILENKLSTLFDQINK